MKMMMVVVMMMIGGGSRGGGGGGGGGGIQWCRGTLDTFVLGVTAQLRNHSSILAVQ